MSRSEAFGDVLMEFSSRSYSCLPVEADPDLTVVVDQIKAARDDVAEYTTKLLLRQRVVNERVVEWSGAVDEGSRILDACSGPEGTLIAVQRRGAAWVGNEIAENTAKYLRDSGANVMCATAEAFDCESDSFDTIFYVFALNNIAATQAAFVEANRVLSAKASVVVADPGPSNWVSDLFLSVLLSDGDLPISSQKRKKILASRRFSKGIPDRLKVMFEGYEISSQDYLNYLSIGMLGVSLEELKHVVPDIDRFVQSYCRSPWQRSFQRTFSEFVHARFFSFIVESAEKQGFGFKRAGVMSTHRVHGSEDWSSTSIFPLDSSSARDFVVNSYAVRNGQCDSSARVIHPGGGLAHNILSTSLLFGR